MAAVSGCGGSHRSDSGAIGTALKTSPASYLHYTAPIWWGRAVRPRLVSVKTDGKYAVAHVSVPGIAKVWSSQWTLLRSTGAPGGDAGEHGAIAKVLRRSVDAGTTAASPTA